MYNEKLEELIDAALADGVLTEKEKQVLFKKAQESGCYRSNFRRLRCFRLRWDAKYIVYQIVSFI